MQKTFSIIMEIIGWLQIVASPLLIGAMIGAVIYFPNPSQTKLIIAVSIVALGLVIGIIWASKIWKTKGTMSFLSSVSATSDLDNLGPIKDNKQEKSNLPKTKNNSNATSNRNFK